MYIYMIEFSILIVLNIGDRACVNLIFDSRRYGANGAWWLLVSSLSLLVQWSHQRDTDSRQVPLTLCLYDPNFIYVGYRLPFRHNKLVHLPYIAVATNTRGRKGEELLFITEANTIVGLYPNSLFFNPMFLLTNSLSIVNTFFLWI